MNNHLSQPNAFGAPTPQGRELLRGKGAPPVFLQILLFFFFFFFLPLPAHANFSDHAHLISPPQKAPPLVYEDADHVQHALSSYKGHFVLLNLWATWCSPCIKEMPSLEDLQKIMGAQLAVLPLSEDRTDTAVSAFYLHHALTHLPVAIDSAGIAPSALQARGLPTTFLINPEGQEIARFEGNIAWNSPETLAFLRTQLTAQSRP